MKRRNRDIAIFGMSALDLFASAMGAFILIAIVIFPYFPNIGSADQRDLDQALRRLHQEEDNNDALQAILRQIREDLEQRLRRVQEDARARINAAQQAADQARQDAAEARRAADQARQDAAEARRAADQARQDAARAQEESDAAQREADAAQRELEDLMFPDIDLVIALDVTNSMTNEINGLKAEVNDILYLLNRMAPSAALGIVAFTDRCLGAPVSAVELTDVGGPTTRLTNFVNELGPVDARCNNDNPEAFLAALRTATAANWRPSARERRVMIVTDNPAYPHEVEAAVAAARSFAGAGGGRSVSTVHVSTAGAESNTGAFLERVADAGGGEAVAAGGSMTANLLRSML